MRAVPFVLAVNVLVFGVMGVSTGEWSWSARQLLGWGGNFGLLTLHGQWWRLLTAQYVHSGFGHIFGNMALLALAGVLVERRIGAAVFLLVYTVSGVAAGMLSAYAHPAVVSVGASGAIAGLVGVLVALSASGRCPEISGRWVAQIVVINAAYSLAPHVDWTAHLGGFVTGLAGGGMLLLTPRFQRPALLP